MPIDIASGAVHLEYDDAAIPGAVDLVWDRRYNASSPPHTWQTYGPGWFSRYASALTRHADGFEFVTPAGAVEFFPDAGGAVARGEVVRLPGAFLELFRQGRDLVVRSWNVDTDQVQAYRFAAGPLGERQPLSRVEDLTGRGLDLVRDPAGRVVEILQRPEGRTLRLHYRADGRLGSVTAGRTGAARPPLARYEYDDAGRLAAAYDALDFADRYEYDARGRLAREIGKDGGVVSYRYDQRGRCVWMSGLDRYDEKRLRFMDAAYATEVRDSYDAVRVYEWLPSGQIVREVDPAGGEKRTEYDDHGRIVARTSPGGATTRFAYDAGGNRASVADALGNTYTFRYNDDHQPVGLTDPNGNVWTREYDARARLARTEGADGSRWALEYDDAGNLISLINPRGHTRRFAYDRGVLRESTDWMGQRTSVVVDDLGRLVARTDPLGRAITCTYDAVGNAVRVGFPDGSVVAAEYNPAGALTRIADGEGRTTAYRVGPCNRVLERTDPDGAKTSYTWGTEPSRLERVVNARGDSYRFVYDAAGRCVAQVAFDGRETRYDYDPAGQCVRVTNAAGETIEVERDLLGSVVGERLSDGTTSRFAYDKLRNLVEAANAGAVVRLERDAAGRVTREVQGEHWVAYTVDPMGEIAGVATDLGLRVSYELDPNGDWSALRTGTRDVHFLRDAGGQELRRDLPGRLTLDQSYDAMGRLSGQTLRRADVTSKHRANNEAPPAVVRRSYWRDRSGTVGRIEDAYAGTTQYAYDPAERLTQARRDRGPSESFAYDPVGNILLARTSEHGTTRETPFRYTPEARLAAAGDTRYEYDRAGRLVMKTEDASSEAPRVWRYEWNALDQLLSVTRPDGTTWRYQYDALARRIAKSGPTAEVRYLWNGNTPIHETSTAAGDWTAWLFAKHSFAPLLQLRGPRAFSVVADHLGTPQELADDAGTVVWRLRARAYGLPYDEEARDVTCPFRFQGQFFDAESGLCYNRFRAYDGAVGRYITPDPLGLKGDENAYAYVHNPAAWIDPFGLAKKKCLSDPNPIPAPIRAAYEDVKLGRGTPRTDPGTTNQTIFRADNATWMRRRDRTQWAGSREWDVPGTPHRILERPDGRLGYVLNHDYNSPFLFPAPWYPEGGAVPARLGGP